MKTIAITLRLDCLPFELNLRNIADAIDEQMRAMEPAGYLGKAMAVNDGLPMAALFVFDNNSDPDVNEVISAFMSIIGQAVVAFGGWSLWDSIRNECGAWELEEHELPDLYAQLVGNLKHESK